MVPVTSHRWVWGVGLIALALVLAGMVWTLLVQLDRLSTAKRDNVTWTLTQVETELANLETTLARHGTGAEADAGLRLRADVALSRVNLVSSGVVGAMLQSTPEGLALVEPLETYADEISALLDRAEALDTATVAHLTRLTADIRPPARALALYGVELSVAADEAQRAAFARTLRRTGGVAILLVVALAVLVLRLQQARTRAAAQDRALGLSNRRLGSTVAASLDAIIIADQTGRVVEFNAAAQTILGWRRQEILGARMDETLIPEAHRAAHRAGMARFLATGERRVSDAGRIEITALRKSGEEFPVELNITSAEGPAGTEFIAYLRDISDRKQAEASLIEARDRAQQADRAKSEFLAIMSHEMRTPLNGILGVLDLLRTTRLADKQAGYVDIAAASGEILLEHVNEALDITRIETGELVLSPQVFDLRALVESVCAVLAPLADEKGLALRQEVSEQLASHFKADAGRIRQILINLLGNAVKFTPSGAVTLSVGSGTGGTVEFTVRDTGPGIRPEDLDRIFEDYRSLAPSGGRQRRGDGLGLSIARRIARRLGGDLTVTSPPDTGASFTLSLPLNRAAAEARAPVTEGSGAPSPRGKRVLVVEDNDTNRRLLGDMLTGLGHEVTHAVDGQAGVTQARARAFDLIFMDISMPVMDGIAATRHLRVGPGPNRATPIIGLTAHGDDVHRHEAQQAGMTAYHVKPIRLAALRDILGGTLGARADEAVTEGSALEEACALIGAERLAHHAARFEQELSAFTSLLREPDGDDPAEAAHRLKGAAGLLGLSELEILLGAQPLDAEEIERGWHAAKARLHRVLDVAAKPKP